MAPSPKPDRRKRERDRDRHRGGHSRHISTDELLPRDGERHYEDDEERRRRRRERARAKAPPSTVATSNALSAGALAQLNAFNENQGPQAGWDDGPRAEPRRPDRVRQREQRTRDPERGRRHRVEKTDHSRRIDTRDHNHYREKSRRVVSGPLAEEGGVYDRHDRYTRHERYDEKRPRIRGGTRSSDSDDRARRKKKKRKRWIIIGVIILVLVLIIAIAVGVSKNNSSSPSSSSSSSKPTNSNLKGLDPSSIPASAKGTYLDPFTWYDTNDFNLTYTSETVGGLPIMGLNTAYDNSVRANPAVPPISEPWDYAGGSTKIHGMNVGGWLSLEPFITPSLFEQFSTADNVVDEYTFTSKLGATESAEQLEKHYATFITAQTFADIRAAGFDHVRISFSYWAVTTYPGDPYVKQISFRYLLRGIEYCRQNGLRVNLDLHGAPGSQNGWNHSGRQGDIGWLNGTDGALNGQRTIEVHKQLGAFFGQERYKGLVTMYGLVNEPKMISLSTESVITWSQQAITAVRAAGLPSDVIIVIGDGFLGLANWAGSALSSPTTLLDAHQYVIFNVEQIKLSHSDKIRFACQGWTQQSQQSMNAATGFGSFLCGEWSQADTDCQTYLNNVNTGNRWEGTYDSGNATTSVLQPSCPTAPQNGGGGTCSCSGAMSDPSNYSSAYKQFLRMFAEAQLHSYEKGWGSFYWTWKTEDAVQWSYELGMKAGILPRNVREREFDCSQDVPDFEGMGLEENF